MMAAVLAEKLSLLSLKSLSFLCSSSFPRSGFAPAFLSIANFAPKEQLSGRRNGLEDVGLSGRSLQSGGVFRHLAPMRVIYL
jgi:hypothetical protein